MKRQAPQSNYHNKTEKDVKPRLESFPGAYPEAIYTRDNHANIGDAVPKFSNIRAVYIIVFAPIN